MIKQTALLFKLGELQVFSITYVGSKTLVDATSSPTATITEEIWWVNKEKPKGVGPFTSLYAAMTDYERHNALKAVPPAAPPKVEYETDVIPVDFKNKVRLAYETL